MCLLGRRGLTEALVLDGAAVAKDEEGFDRDMRTIFVAQVARKADERDLFGFFSECGKVGKKP